MIKFRCSNCGQKIAVNDEGAGVAIACPTCAGNIIVPLETAAEFQPLLPALTLAEPSARSALIPHLARMMMDKLVRALLSQRAHLMETQETSTERVAELEQRLIKAQEQLQARFVAYERRIADLEMQLVTAKVENDELTRAKLQLARRVLKAEATQERSRVDLRDAGFLLRT